MSPDHVCGVLVPSVSRTALMRVNGLPTTTGQAQVLITAKDPENLNRYASGTRLVPDANIEVLELSSRTL